MSVLQGLEPASVLKFFEEISEIPHISYHEQELSNYCVAFAKERGLYCEQDELGNVIIIGEATLGYEDVEPVIIQGHLDMVGDKVPECELDLEKDAIRLMVDGDYITADGTTLGGDDGVAVAYALALLDSKDIPHPRLEVVLTVSEEVGLEGATAIDMSCCKAKRLINIDSEEEGVFTAGCAGGRRVTSEIPLKRETKKGVLCEMHTEGLLGGHSGIEIHKGRVNGNRMVARFLLFLKETVDYSLASMSGGVKDNVIPKNAKVQILVAREDIAKTESAVAEFNQYMNDEYGTADPNTKLVFVVKEESECVVLDAMSKEKLLTALNLLPNGVQAMSADLPGLVETSLNMGVVEMQDDMLTIHFAVRSSVTSAKEQLSREIKQLTEMLGGTASYHGDYPAWPYARDSKFRDLCVQVHEEMYGKKPKIDIIHAGLECGILSGKVEGLECISIGPNMYDVHTPDERISISSVARVWEFLKELLARK